MFNSYQMYFTDNFTCRIIFPCVALCGLLMCVVGKQIKLVVGFMQSYSLRSVQNGLPSEMCSAKLKLKLKTILKYRQIINTRLLVA